MAKWSGSRRAMLVACMTAASITPGFARAQPAVTSPPPAPDGDAQLSPSEKIARHANELYQQGQYREAIAEYSEASRLDPKAPILVRNIAVLHEKLGEVDEALEYFHKYGGMDISPEDRKRTEVDIRRLEGAKKEIAEKERLRRLQDQAPPPTVVAPVEAPPRGRIDALTIGFAGGAAVGLVAGTILSIKASSDRPSSGFVTGRDGTYSDLSNKASSAHREAIFADICFGVGIAAGVTAALLYALRTKDPKPPVVAEETAGVSALPLPGGGAIFVHGAF